MELTLIAIVRINPDQPHICPAEHRFSSKRFSYPQFFFSWLLRNPGSQNYRAARVSEVEAMCREQMNISLNISGQNLLSLCGFQSIVMLVAQSMENMNPGLGCGSVVWMLAQHA